MFIKKPELYKEFGFIYLNQMDTGYTNCLFNLSANTDFGTAPTCLSTT